MIKKKIKKYGFSLIELVLSISVLSVALFIITKFFVSVTSTTKSINDVISIKTDLSLAKLKLNNLFENAYVIFPSGGTTTTKFLPCGDLSDSAFPIYPCQSGGNKTNQYYVAGYDDSLFNRSNDYNFLNTSSDFINSGSVLHFLTIEPVDANDLLKGEVFNSEDLNNNNRLGPSSSDYLDGTTGKRCIVRVITDNIIYLRKMKNYKGEVINRRELVLKSKRKWYLAKEDPTNLGKYIPDVTISDAKKSQYSSIVVDNTVTPNLTEYDVILRNLAFRLSNKGYLPWTEKILPKSTTDTNSNVCPLASDFGDVDISPNSSSTTRYSQTECMRSPILYNTSNYQFLDYTTISLPSTTGILWSSVRNSSDISLQTNDILSSPYDQKVLMKYFSENPMKNMIGNKDSSKFRTSNSTKDTSEFFPDGLGFIIQVSLPRTVTNSIAVGTVTLPVISNQTDYYITGLKMILSLYKESEVNQNQEQAFKFSSIYEFDFKANRLALNN